MYAIRSYYAALSAQRELLEETGYRADEMVLIGECFPQPAILSNRCFFYLAQNAAEAQPQHLDSGEDIEIIKIPLKQIPAKIENNRITSYNVCYTKLLRACVIIVLMVCWGFAMWGFIRIGRMKEEIKYLENIELHNLSNKSKEEKS